MLQTMIDTSMERIWDEFENKLREAQSNTFGKMPDYPVMDFSTFNKKWADGSLFTEFNHN